MSFTYSNVDEITHLIRLFRDVIGVLSIQLNIGMHSVETVIASNKALGTVFCAFEIQNGDVMRGVEKVYLEWHTNKFGKLDRFKSAELVKLADDGKKKANFVGVSILALGRKTGIPDLKSAKCYAEEILEILVSHENS